jgi:hypothetical protein
VSFRQQNFHRYDSDDRKILIDLLREYSEKLIAISRQMAKHRDSFSQKDARAIANRLELVMRLVVEINDQIEKNPVRLLELDFALDGASYALERYYSIAEAKEKQFKFWNIFTRRE